jgi:hypothetical protein
MVTTLNDRDLPIIESMDQPMFLIDAPRPVASVIETQGLRLANTLRRVFAGSQTELDDTLQLAGIVPRPPIQVLQSGFSPGKA